MAVLMPVVLAASVFGMNLTGMSLNMMSISGLALGIGLLVDSAVVVLDRLDGAAAENHPAIMAGLVRPLFASCLTNIVVFIPFAFMPSDLSMFASFAKAISITSLCGFLFALGGVPVLYKKLTPGTSPSAAAPALFTHIEGLFLRLAGAAERRKKTVLTVVAGFLIFAVSLLPFLKQENIEPFAGNEIRLFIEAPAGTSLDRTRDITKDVTRRILLSPKVKRVSSRVDPYHAAVTVFLRKRYDFDTVTADLRRRVPKAPDYFIHFGSGTEFERAVDIEIAGGDTDALRQAAKTAARQYTRVLGVEDVLLGFKRPRPVIHVRPSFENTARLSVSPAQIGAVLKGLNHGNIVTKFFNGEREFDVRLVLDRPPSVEKYSIHDASQKTAPIIRYAEVRRQTAESRRTRKNGRKMVTLTVKYTGDTGALVSRLERIHAGMRLPTGMVIGFADGVARARQNRSRLIFAVILSVVLIYLFLGIIFNDLKKPLIVLLAVPGGLAVILVALPLFGRALSVPVFIGMMLTTGLVVNNAIILVDGFSKDSADLWGAARQRLKPILITSGTTLLGAVPMLFFGGIGSNLFGPLAFTIFWGMLGSTGMTLFSVPLVYRLMIRP